MKNRILLTAALCMSMMAEITAQGYTSLREQIQLAGEWESSLGTCRLPGTTDENRLGERNRDTLVTYQLTRLYPYSGKVIYTREINIPESFRGKKLFLMMERTKPSTVWVDGDSIGSYGHLYAPHRYELPALAVGKHQLKIRIDNSPTSVPKEIQGSHARWGRSMEGAGEDPWYGSQVAKARVEGFQGTDYNDRNTVLACAKHFAAYGAAVAGKDYAEADISEHTLLQVYLPPFRAAVEAGVGTFMNAFNEINGIPATAHKPLLRDILKGEWGFNGFVVSDWGSVGEIAKHRMAKDNEDAGRLAAIAGCDMDMHSMTYARHLVNLVKQGAVDITLIDDAVKRILTVKFELGLFDDPYRYNYREREIENKKVNAAHRKVAREAGAGSVVLLKNQNVLPVTSTAGKIAVVGPLNKAKKDMLGNWSAIGKAEEVISVFDGLKAALPKAKITYIEGYDLETNELKPLPDFSEYDVIIVSVGERAMESGEAKSKVDININANQQLMVKQIKEKAGKPVITLVMGGRPLIFSDMEPYADAILMTWWLGTEAGNSIADVLTGKYNPSGKLPMTFPRHVGQCPLYYNHKSTGRAWAPNNPWVSGYMDESVKPAYVFGYGLSYTTFEIAAPVMSKKEYKAGEPVVLTTSVTNTGQYTGKETVQLYLQDVVSSVTRPVIELCGIRQVELAPGETRKIEFTLSEQELGFFNSDKQLYTESGDFKLFVGSSSDNLKATEFELIKK